MWRFKESASLPLESTSSLQSSLLFERRKELARCNLFSKVINNKIMKKTLAQMDSYGKFMESASNKFEANHRERSKIQVMKKWRERAMLHHIKEPHSSESFTFYAHKWLQLAFPKACLSIQPSIEFAHPTLSKYNCQCRH